MSNTELWHLVARKLSGEASLDELRQLEQLIKDDPELGYRIDVYTNYFEHPSNENKRTETGKQQSWTNLTNRLKTEFPADFSTDPAIPESPSFNSNRKWKFLVAASLIIAVAGFLFLKNYHADSDKQLTDDQAITKEMNTMPGTRSRTILPDGTIVWLNSDSRVTYNTDFGKHKREVTLVGEAFFDVAHNAQVPMVVHAKNVNIWVKGTAFNVRSYPETGNVETSLIRGVVELTTSNDPERKILLKPNEKITIEVRPEVSNDSLDQNKRFSATTQGGLYHIDRLKESAVANVIPEISWVENKLVFDNEKFGDIIRKMEKWYNVEIVLENKKLEGKSFSGVFGKENISQAFEAMQIINHFSFEMKDGKIYIK